MQTHLDFVAHFLSGQRIQSRDIELNRVIAALLESPWPLLDACLRQSILRTHTLADLDILANRAAASPDDHSADVASLCVGIS